MGCADFKSRVLGVVKEIPKSSFLTYKQVAQKAGSPKAFRVVGNILNKNKDCDIPCHRVVRKTGFIGGYNLG